MYSRYSSSTRKNHFNYAKTSASLARSQTPPNFLQPLLLSSTLYITKPNQSNSATMSSPVSRRSNKSRSSATPVRSAQNPEQLANSPARSFVQAPSGAPDTASVSGQESRFRETPRASRQTLASSSPLFFRSSPANGATGIIANDGMDISSPLRDTSLADSTPRGRLEPPGGILDSCSSKLSIS